MTLEMSLEPPVRAAVPNEMAMVVDALLSNALRFSDRGDRVTVLVQASADDIEVQVTDTGIGILHEDLPHVFDRFYRGALGRDRALGGSGLGLSVAREIAEVHGGSVEAASTLGKGSCFTLRMPAESADAYTA